MTTRRQAHLAALALAAVFTLAIFSGVAQLAAPTPSTLLLAQSLSQPAQG